MLQSVVDIAPVAFVKLGQDSAGQVDYKLAPDYTFSIDGNVNYYNEDPTNKVGYLNPSGPDHENIYGFQMLKSKYFESRINSD